MLFPDLLDFCLRNACIYFELLYPQQYIFHQAHTLIIRIAVFLTFSVKLFSNYFLFFFFPVGKTIGNISSW